jgi:hypothetical protein
MTTFIPTKIHGILDYAGGLLIMASPWLFGFAHLGGAPFIIPLMGGGIQLLITVFTNHETGLIKVLPLQMHLIIDVFLGFTLLVSPFLYEFYPFVWLPHFILGLFNFGSGIFTQHSPFLNKPTVFNERGM